MKFLRKAPNKQLLRDSSLVPRSLPQNKNVRTLMKPLRKALLLSPLITILISPFYGMFLAAYYSSFFGDEIDFSGSVTYGLVAIVFVLPIGYFMTATYGLFIWWVLGKLKWNSFFHYLLFGCIPGLFYGLYRPLWIEGFFPGVLFGGSITICFWMIVHKLKSDSSGNE